MPGSCRATPAGCGAPWPGRTCSRTPGSPPPRTWPAKSSIKGPVSRAYKLTQGGSPEQA